MKNMFHYNPCNTINVSIHEGMGRRNSNPLLATNAQFTIIS